MHINHTIKFQVSNNKSIFTSYIHHYLQSKAEDTPQKYAIQVYLNG